MSTLALAVAIVLCTHVAWRRDLLSPPAVACFVGTLSMAAFHAVTINGWRPMTMLTWWQIAGDYAPVAGYVMLFYLGLVGIAYTAWCAGGSTAAPASPSVRGDVALAHALVSPPALAAWLALAALFAWHAASIDWTPLFYSADHLEARTPRGVGLAHPLLGPLHRQLPMLGCLLAPAVALASRSGRPIPTTIITLLFTYAALVACGIGTRFFILQLVILTVSFHVLRGERRFSPPAALAATATLLAYLVFVATRRGKQYGLVPTWETLVGGDFLSADLPLYVGLSIFGGPFTLAEALQRPDPGLPTAYKLLSFSPLPSSLDGFAVVRDAAQVRVMDRAPFGGIAEAYLFGPPYLFALLAALLVALFLLGAFWRRHRGAAALLVLAPAYYALAAIHLYPLRNTFRWLALTTLAAAALLALGAWRRRITAATVTFVGTLPPPVTGRTLATRHVVDTLADRAGVRLIDVSGRGRPAFRLAKLARTTAALLQLSLLPRAEGASLYLVANHARGLWYDVALVALARLRGYRIFLHHQVYRYVATRDRRMTLVHRMMRPGDTHILLSPRMVRDFQATYPGPRQYLVVSNAIVTITDPCPARRTSPAPLVLGHLSNLTLAKGLDTVIATFEKLREKHADARLVLAGPVGGEQEQRLIDAARGRWGDAVEHRGPVYDDAKRQFFADVDVLLLPTRYENEAQPLVIAEALRHGVPVIACGRGCIPEQLADAGVAVPPEVDFVAAAAAAIDAWRRDPQAWADELDRTRAAGRTAKHEAKRQLQRLVEEMVSPPLPLPLKPLSAAEVA